MVTKSTKRAREYQRAFDHDEAQRLRDLDPDTWSYSRLARHFGVTPGAVQRVLDPSLRQKMDQRTKAYIASKRKPCKGGCGKLVWGHMKDRSGYCSECVYEMKFKPERDDALRCGACGEWKPDEEFHKGKAKSRRGRAFLCRPCSNVARRIYRARNSERERERERNHKRQRKERVGDMSKWIVLQANGSSYVECARVDTATAIGAIEKAATTAGEFVAVSEARFQPMTVEATQRFCVVPQSPQ